MLHYPLQVQMFGPLVSCWTMRHESKLSFVERVSHLSNHENVCKTVAKHQFWMCYLLLEDEHLLSPTVDFSPKT